MKKQPHDEVTTNVTTEATLIALLEHVTRVLEDGTLDSRVAAKLAKQLNKGATEIENGPNSTKDGRRSIKKVLAALNESLIAQESQTLVKALAKLRDKDTEA